MNVAQMLGSMGIVGLAVMVCLLALSVYSFGVILDRFRHFRAAASASGVFLPELGRCLKSGALQDAAVSARRHERSPVARLVAAGVNELIENRDTIEDTGERIELVSRALQRSTTRTLTEMRQGLGGLATIGSTAPFIGLFGTVVGIINAFHGIGSTGSGGFAAVSSGIAEALVATALGILVAIPAVMAFNHFTGALERLQAEMETTADELVAFLSKRAHAVHAPR